MNTEIPTFSYIHEYKLKPYVHEYNFHEHDMMGPLVRATDKQKRIPLVVLAAQHQCHDYPSLD